MWDLYGGQEWVRRTGFRRGYEQWNVSTVDWGLVERTLLQSGLTGIPAFRYGDGIYANQNPAMAHRFTVRKVDHDSRVVILCSIVELEPGAPVENILDYSVSFSVYCLLRVAI